MKKNIILILLIAPLFLLRCDIKHSTIPEVAVDFYIYPNDVSYLDLNYYGGYVYVTGGVSGIIIYRINEFTFMAFDRACPYDWAETDSWLWMEESGLTIKCSKCGSQFNVINGAVIDGIAEFPLKYYKTSYNGVRLRVYN